jgi:HAD superfamily hydrolase (TIGR01490 family)
MLVSMTSHPDHRLDDLPSDSLVFCDIDNTVVLGASVYLFGVEAYRYGLIGWRDVVPALLDQRHFLKRGENEKRMANTQERALALLKGHTVEDFATVAHTVWREKMRDRLFPEMVGLLDEHVAAGHKVYLASAGPEDLVTVIASGLGLTGALGTRLETVGNIYTGRVEGSMLHGPVKAEAAFALADSLGVPRSKLVAYSDSYADLPLLDGVGHPVAVNPDRRLHDVATEKGWPIVWPVAAARYRRYRL